MRRWVYRRSDLSLSPSDRITLLYPWQLVILQFIPLQQFFLRFWCHDDMLRNLRLDTWSNLTVYPSPD